MSQYARLMQVVSASWFVLICGVGSSFADGGPFITEGARHGLPFVACWIMLPIFLATVVVEYLVVGGFLVHRTKAWGQLFLWVLLMNVITNPAAQLAIVFSAVPVRLRSLAFSSAVLCVIELLVVAVEFLLLRWIFGRMHSRGAVSEPVTLRRTLVIAVVANLASLVFGTAGGIALFAAAVWARFI